MATFSTLLFIILSITICTGLYEDQIGSFDWKRSFIGKVKHARFSDNYLIVTTEQNVVANLSPKTGKIIWRQTLENPPEQPQFLNVDKEVVVVSTVKDSFYVRGWDTPTGSLLWEWTINPEIPVDSFWGYLDHFLLHIAIVRGSHLEVTLYDPRTGEVQLNAKKIPTSWLKYPTKCILTSPYFVCLNEQQLMWVDISSEVPKFSSKSVETILGDSNVAYLELIEFESPKPLFLLLHKNKINLLEIKDDSIQSSPPHNVFFNSIYVEQSIFHLEVNTENVDKLITIKSKSLNSGDEVSVGVPYPLGLGAPYIVAAQCKANFCELLLSSTDNALTLVTYPDGKVLWTREEALSEIVAVEFFELPVSELDASIEKEFTNSDIVSMLIHRLSTQIHQLYNLIFGGQLLSNSGLIRDDFGLHKIIVVATQVGKLFAIDTLTGSIVWSYRLPDIKPFNDVTMLLFVQRTARYAPLAAQCVLLAQNADNGGGIIFVFDPITGISKQGIEQLNYKIKQAVIVPYEDNSHVRPVIVISQDNSVYVYPESARDLVQKYSEKTFVYLVDSSVLQGFKLGADVSIAKIWNVNFGSAHVAAISTRPLSEHVHSQGRVLPDRSVYYKYVNPNLIAVATLSDDPVHKHVLSVYLIDGVTGLILYSISHKRASGPVYLVHSENWLVYTFFNERYRRTEIVAAELFEGHTQSNSTAFSSFGVSQLPHIQTQSYILPANPVTVSVTLTERGITNKFLLVGLSNGAVTEIPWMLLQPRFPDIPCGPEESCIPYMPEVPLPAEATINYNQSLIRIKGIQVAPARLESTSHVLVYGLDLFYTRVAPSKTFDVLKEDFDHKLIVLVLSGLVIASYVTKYLASRKALKQAWK